MSSKLVLKNSGGGEFSINNLDGVGAKDLSSADFKYIRNTVAEIPTVENPGDGDVLLIKGYHENSDGGHGTFVWDPNADKSEHNGGTVIDPLKAFPSDWDDENLKADWFNGNNNGTGCWRRLYDGAVNVKWFGAKGDGVADDTQAVQKIIDEDFKSVYVDGSYYVNNLTFSNSYSTFFGSNINSYGFYLKDNLNKIGTVTGDIIIFKDLFFSGNKQAVNECLIEIADNIQGAKFFNCFFGFIDGNSTTNPSAIKQYALKISNENVQNFKIENCRFKYINNWDEDNQQAGNGFAGGVLIISTKEASTIKGSSGVINNTEFMYIYTKDIEDDPSHTDADGIRIYQYSEANTGNCTDNNYVFSNLLFKGVQKSGIKIAQASNISISNIIFEVDNSLPDMEDVKATAAVRLQFAKKCVIDNVVAKGNMSKVIGLFASDVIVNNILYNSDNGKYNAGNIIHFYYDEENCNMDNITLNNIRGDNFEYFIQIDDNVNEQGFIGSNLKISNLNIGGVYDPTAPTNAIILTKINGVSLSKIQHLGLCNTFIVNNSCNNVAVSDVNSNGAQLFYSNSTDIEGQGKNVVLSNCNIVCDKSNSELNDRIIELRNTVFLDDRNIGYCNLNNITINTNSTNINGNTTPIILEADYINISNVKVVLKDYGTDSGSYRRNNIVYIVNSKFVNIDTISYYEERTDLTNDCYAVYLSAATYGIINNIFSSYQGVYAGASVSDTIITNVKTAGKAFTEDSNANNIQAFNFSAAGNDTILTGNPINFSSNSISLSNLPTSDPSVAGQLWNDSGTVKVSAG